MKQLIPIYLPKPIPEITSRLNVIVTNEGEWYSPYESWCSTWENCTEEQKLESVNAEYASEIESGFAFDDEESAELFVTAMRYLAAIGRTR